MTTEQEQKKIAKDTLQSSSFLEPMSTPLLPSLSSPELLPSTPIQAPLDQFKILSNQSVPRPISPLLSANINNTCSIPTAFSKSIISIICCKI
jgi:hypothetical protein